MKNQNTTTKNIEWVIPRCFISRKIKESKKSISGRQATIVRIRVCEKFGRRISGEDRPVFDTNANIETATRPCAMGLDNSATRIARLKVVLVVPVYAFALV